MKTKGEEGRRGRDDQIASLTSRHEFEQTPGDSEQQESLVCCSSWGCKESDTTSKESDTTKPLNNKIANQLKYL